MPYCSSCGRSLTGEDRFCAACGAPQPVAPPPESPPPTRHPAPTPPGQAPPPTPAVRQPFPGWAVALLVILAVSALSLFAVFVLPLYFLGGVVSSIEAIVPSPGADRAAEVRSGVRNIQMGIETWCADSARGTYPPEAVVTPQRLRAYVDPWPVNPYTGASMQPGGGPGDYDYVRLPGGEVYTLTGYGGDGSAVLTAP